MEKAISRLSTLITVCSMFAVLLTYSPAMAENPSDIYQEDNICTVDTLDTGTFDEPLVSSDATANDDVVPNACVYCTSSSDCDDLPFGPYFCNTRNNCCAPW